jgi:hypothetical protein
MNRLAVAFALVAAVVVTSLSGCAEPHSIMVKRPENPQVDAAVTTMWSHEIHDVAKDGDWILSRSYYLVADGISVIAPGEPLSHASIYDAKRDTVIEAVGSGVREIPLSQLVQRNHYLIVVHPSGMTDDERRHAVERARTRIGTPFDTTGMLGFNSKDKLYCSELVWWAAQGELRYGDHHTIITPAGLMNYGAVVYWSGKRTDEQVMALAIDSGKERAKEPAPLRADQKRVALTDSE